MTDNPSPASPERKTIVFICYARANQVAVDRIVIALEERGFDVRIDRKHILAGEDWRARIRVLIAQVDKVVFMISDRAVDSPICKFELEFAASLNKRILPIVLESVSTSRVPDEASGFRWIDFTEPERFDALTEELARALETDIAWIRKHTEFGEHARRWDLAGRPGPSGLMLRPPLLTEAEDWLRSHRAGWPEPTENTRAFMAASRAAYDQENERLKKDRAAARLVKSRFLAQLVRQQNEKFDFGTAVALGLEAIFDPDEAVGRSIAEEAIEELEYALRYIRERRVLRGHKSGLLSAVFDPSGSRVLTASWDDTAGLWDATSGARLLVLRGHEDWVDSAIFDPTGGRVLTSSADGTARLWDASSGAELLVFGDHESSVESAVFDPSGERVLTAFRENNARIWDASSGTELAVLRGHTDALWSAVFDPLGERVLTASADGTARLWDAASGGELAVLRTPDGIVYDAVFDSRGARLITRSGYTVRLWDGESGSELAILKGHRGAVSSAIFDPTGERVLTASADGTARMWDSATGVELVVYQGHRQELRSAVFAPDGRTVLTSSSDRTARLWHAGSATELVVGPEPTFVSPDAK